MFITFEGIDGCGKTTQIKNLAEYFENQGKETLTFREPGGTDFSEVIREILLSSNYKLSPEIELMLFEAARFHLVDNVIKPALNQGKIVLSDRFYDSTTAYQGYGRGLNLDIVKLCNKIGSGGIIPNITFYLHLSLEQAKARAGKRQMDNIELSGDVFFHKVINGFISISKEEPERVIMVDATGSIKDTFNLILKYLDIYLKKDKIID